MKLSIDSNWMRSYLDQSNRSALTRRVTVSDSGNKWSCRLWWWWWNASHCRDSLVNFHNVWFISNGTGHTGLCWSTSRLDVTCDDNQWTRVKIIVWVFVGGFHICRCKYMSTPSPKPETFNERTYKSVESK